MGTVAGVAGIGFTVGCCVLSADRYRGPVSDHFDGERFRNRTAQPRGFGDVIKWMTSRQVGPWRDWVDAAPGPRPPLRSDRLRITFVNHSTLLIQVAGLNILTDFEEIGRRFGRIDVAMLPIGAYRPRWFMAPVHIDPQDAVRAHLALGARTSIGMHFGTFVQADDGETEPIEELNAALDALPQPRPDFRVPEHGVAMEFGG